MRLAAITLAVAITAAPTLARAGDNTTFTGTVRENISHKPVPNARITLICGNDRSQATSDANGRLTITTTSPGRCSAEAAKDNAFIGTWRLPRPLHLTLQPGVTLERDLYIEFHAELEGFRPQGPPKPDTVFAGSNTMMLQFYPGIVVAGPGAPPVH